MMIADRLKQHQAVRRVFRQIVNAADIATRRESMQRLVARLAALETLREQHMLQLILEELPQLDLEDELFQARVTVLAEVAERHLDEADGIV
jgi:hypothetical protein